MLKEFTIQNFKCYKEPTTFDLSLVTFIYGNNSVGKSTFLQAVSKLGKLTDPTREGSFERGDTFKGEALLGAHEWRLICGNLGSSSCEDWMLGPADAPAVDGSVRKWALKSKEGEVSRKRFADLVSVQEHVQAIAETVSDFEALVEELTSEQVDLVNQMFDELKIGYECIDAHHLRDTVLGYGPLSVDMVGAGIQRLFRTVKALAKWEKGILLLEEPETNVNEGQFAALAHIITQRALSLRKKGVDAQVVVECHSEHILLESLLMVRRRELPLDDLRIVYVSKNETGSRSMTCRIDEKGRLLQWGDESGFFRARDRILFGVR